VRPLKAVSGIMETKSVCYDESADAIIDGAGAVGVDISKGQLSDWHRAGLIPEPQIEYPGGGGSRSIYPQGTLQQAIACAQLMKRRRSNDQVGWTLWLNGFEVHEDLWSKQFIEAHRFLQNFRRKAEKAEEFTKQLDRALRRIPVIKRLPNVLGQVRRRLGKKQLGEALGLIMAVALGTPSPSDEQENP
jgi:hypothetical protein